MNQRPDNEAVEDADEAERQQVQEERTSDDAISPEVNLSSGGLFHSLFLRNKIVLEFVHELTNEKRVETDGKEEDGKE